MIGQGDHQLHGGITHDHRLVVVGDGGQDGGDHLCIRGQGDELLRPGADSVGGAPGVRIDAAGHHRNLDALGLVGGDQGGNIEVVVHQQQIGALTGAQGVGGRRDGLHVAHLGARRHSHLHGGGQLPVQFSDDQKPHVLILL